MRNASYRKPCTRKEAELKENIDELKEIIGEIYRVLRKSGSEDRPTQKLMSYDVLDTLILSAHSLLEAPTGTGKTYAYLIAALVYAIYKNETIAISTATKGLQEQLLRDFARIQRVVESVTGKAVNAAVLKGRNNYVSRKRYHDYLLYHLAELTDDKRLQEITEWLETTTTGELDEVTLPYYLPASGICATQASNDDKCFYELALSRCRGAKIIITNHHSIIGRFKGNKTEDKKRFISLEDLKIRKVIFDEAHEIERIASELFSDRVSLYEIRSNIKALGRFSKDKIIGDKLKIGNRNAYDQITADAETMSAMIEQLRAYRESDERLLYVDRNGQNGNKRNWLSQEIIESALRKIEKCIKNAQGYSSQLLASAHRKNVEAKSVKESHDMLAGSMDEINNVRKDLRTSSNKLVIYYSPELAYPSIILANSTTWLTLQSAWKKFDALAFTSATLCLPSKRQLRPWDYFCRGIGLPKSKLFRPQKHKYVAYAMPFSYDRVQLYVPPVDAPNPKFNGSSSERKAYIEYMRKAIQHALKNDQAGGIMILFTSYRDMLDTHKAILKTPEILCGRELIIQKPGTHKRIEAEFRANPSEKMLLAVGTFWTGVDFPGEQLTTLMITRLPFAAKDDPINAIRELNRYDGENAYLTIYQPAAIIKFRQGIGRLIRSKNDFGNLYITDSRMRESQFETVVDGLCKNKHVLAFE